MEMMHFKKLTLATALTAAIGFGISTVHADGSYVSVGSSSVSATASVAKASSIEIRVAGPNGYRDTVLGYGGSVMWSAPYGLSDGAYSYDVYVVTGTEGDGEVLRETGSFTVQGGVIRGPGAGDGSASLDADNESSWLAQIGGAVLDFVFPAAQAADLTSSSTLPRIYFDDTSAGTGDWEIFTNVDYASGPLFRLFDRSPATDAVVLDILGGSNNDSAFVTNIGGDIGLANNSVFIDRSAKWLGINTATPANDLHIVSADPTIRLEDAGLRTWEINSNVNSTIFDIADVTAGTSPFGIEYASPTNLLWLDNTNRVGMGTNGPASALHVYRNDGTANILVQEANGSTAARSLLDLENNGPVGFNMLDTSTSDQWRFAAQTTGFRISLAGSGGTEFEVGKDGSLSVGPGASTNMYLSATGNMSISGLLTQGSDRNIKTNIKDLDQGEVLGKIASMPVSQWAYKSEPEVSHVGPMAQDFYAAFGYGADDKHLAPGDLAAVAVVGVKELHEMIKQRDEQIAKLTAQLEQQTALASEVSARLNNLEGVVQRMAKYGVGTETVAMSVENQ